MLLQLDKVDDIEKNSLLDDKIYPLYRHHWNVHLETLQCITLIGLGPYNYLSTLPLSTTIIFSFETLPTVLYFLLFILLRTRNIPTLRCFIDSL
jgi:hypothetical protein